MWWEKKTRPAVESSGIRPVEARQAPPEAKTLMSEPTPKSPNPSPKSSNFATLGNVHTVLGRTAAVQGQLSAAEDLMIEGQFEGNIRLEEHCLTVGTEGRVKAEIHARQVVILGAVTGNLAAREKIEIRRTGHVVGDLIAGTVAIEEGAYFKGSIDIARDGGSEVSRDIAATSTARSGA
jgi:cytoskeletal protein CcmA (bactofilin family)